MKKTRRILAISLALCTISALLLMACGTSKETISMSNKADMMQEDSVSSSAAMSSNASPQTAPESPEEMGRDGGTGFGSNLVSNISAQANERMLIRTVNADVETKEYTVFVEVLQDEIKKSEGYIEYSDESGREGYRNSNLTVRVPKDKLDVFVVTIETNGNVIRKSENVEDVTLNYVDTQTRKKSLEVQRDRLLELLKEAKNVEDIIAIESKLSDVRYQLESQEAQLRTYDNLIDYCTVILHISEVKVEKAVSDGIGGRISAGFKESIDAIGTGATNLFVWVASSSPYILVLVAVAAAIIVIVLIATKKQRRLQRALKEKAKQAESK